MNLSMLSNLDTKKILLIILFLAVCFGLGIGIYFMFFKPDVPGPGEPGYVPPGAELPDVGAGTGLPTGPGGGLPDVGDVEQEPEEIDEIADGDKTSVLSLYEDEVIGLTLSADGNGIAFYDKENSKFYTLSNDGKRVLELSKEEFYQVEDVYWNDAQSQAIITYPDGNKILYDFSKNQQVSLTKEIYEPDFSNQDKIAYKHISDDGETNWIVVADPQGSKVNLIEPLGDQSDFVQIAWSPTNQVVALYSKPIGLDKSEIFFIGLQSENFRSLVVEGSNFKGLWSPNGLKLLYHAVNGNNNYNPNLWIVNAEGDNIGRYEFNLGLTTWVDKCVFADSLTLYCAVPRQLSEGMGLYPELLGNTQDLIYKVNIATGAKELIADPVENGENNFSISSMHLSKDNRYLFFLDGLTNKVYRIQLK